MTKAYDVIVLGVGGIGSAALADLASRGARVLGLERFAVAHDRGSSHGETRIIRKAYFEHPDYVPLLHRSYELWQAHEAERDEKLFFQTGALAMGPGDLPLIQGVKEAAKQHNVPIEPFDHEARRRHYPWFNIPERFETLFEPSGGFLLVEKSVASFADTAVSRGAALREQTVVTGWTANDQGVDVHTETETFSARALIITAGAWANDFVSDALAERNVALTVRRKHLHWFANQRDDNPFQIDNDAPVFFFEVDDCLFYGFPAIDGLGTKVANHYGGETLTDPLRKSDAQAPADDKNIDRFLARFMPTVSPARTQHATCMYTMSPDGHFIVDRHPEHENVVFTTGLSGHGYKFAPVLGEIMADLALNQRTEHPIQFLGLDRFG